MHLVVRSLILFLLILSGVTLDPGRVGMANPHQSPDPQSQTDSVKKTNAGIITGKVTIKGKGAQGIPIILRPDNNDNSRSRPPQKVTTDQDGNYQILNVSPGAYQVVPLALTFVIAGESGFSFRDPLGPNGKAVVVGERERVQNVDFALTPGGVITGRVTDSQGRPLIEHQVLISPVSNSTRQLRAISQFATTDDRGVYRSFGLSGGSYIVSVGQNQNTVFGRGAINSVRYKQTFHPSVTDASKATIIEVSEGSETTNIDITVGVESASDTFAISGSIIDGATGQPLPNVALGLQMSMEGGSSSTSSSAWTSDQAGEFKFQNLNPGKYAVYMHGQNGELRAARVPVEITNQDVTGVIIKAMRGASVSGDVVFENGNLKVDSSGLSQLPLQIFVQTQNPAESEARPVKVNPDGSFRVGGLTAGTAYFRAVPNRGQTMGYRVIQVERDGVVQARGVEVKEAESIARLRVVVRSGNGKIQGIVKAENGELPPPPRLVVWLSIPGEDPTSLMGRSALVDAKLDSRGHFLLENLPAGDYEVNAAVYGPRSMISTKQQVSLTDGTVSEVTLTLNLKPN